MITTRLLIEYDGTAFGGWAAQPGLRTLQGELEGALGTLTGEPVSLTVAGRTDVGVHAWGQVASYAGSPVELKSLNGLIGDDVAVLACEQAADSFDARHDALSRTYCYRVLNREPRSAFLRRRALHVRADLDRDALTACAQALVGKHDFTAFTPTETEHSRFVREVMRAEWRFEGELLSFWIEARSFLRNMNRALVGTMLDVAKGRRDIDEFRGLLDGAPRTEAGHTAAAWGLALAAVRYPDEPNPPLS